MNATPDSTLFFEKKESLLDKFFNYPFYIFPSEKKTSFIRLVLTGAGTLSSLLLFSFFIVINLFL
jgi:hypothetical protein